MKRLQKKYLLNNNTLHIPGFVWDFLPEGGILFKTFVRDKELILQITKNEELEEKLKKNNKRFKKHEEIDYLYIPSRSKVLCIPKRIRTLMNQKEEETWGFFIEGDTLFYKKVDIE